MISQTKVAGFVYCRFMKIKRTIQSLGYIFLSEKKNIKCYYNE